MSTIPGSAALLGAVATLVLAIEAARARAQPADSTSPGQIQQGNWHWLGYSTVLLEECLLEITFAVSQVLLEITIAQLFFLIEFTLIKLTLQNLIIL